MFLWLEDDGLNPTQRHAWRQSAVRARLASYALESGDVLLFLATPLNLLLKNAFGAYVAKDPKLAAADETWLPRSTRYVDTLDEDQVARALWALSKRIVFVDVWLWVGFAICAAVFNTLMADVAPGGGAVWDVGAVFVAGGLFLVLCLFTLIPGHQLGEAMRRRRRELLRAAAALSHFAALHP